MATQTTPRDGLHAAIAAALRALLGPVADGLAARLRRAGQRGTITPTGRHALARWLAATIARLFGVSPADAAARYATPGTVPHLIAAATRAAVAVAAPDGGLPGPADAPTRTWRDPNGHALSDRIWLAGEDARARLTAVLDAGLARGASPDELARELARFIRPEVAGRTVRGDEAFWSARRLVTHEVNRADGLAQIAAARGAGERLAWTVSARHVGADRCDRHAAGGPYTPDTVPAFPAHPLCRCRLDRVPGAGGAVLGTVDGAALVATLTGF